jgi:hypothetical protein
VQSSNLAVRLETLTQDALSQPPRPVLQVVTSHVPGVKLPERPKPSLAFRRFVIRDQGFRTFRVF